MPEKNVQVNTDRGLPYERFLQFGPENLTEAELLGGDSANRNEGGFCCGAG